MGRVLSAVPQSPPAKAAKPTSTRRGGGQPANGTKAGSQRTRRGPINYHMTSGADELLLVRADRACAMLSIGEKSLRRLVREGRIRRVEVGRAILFPVDSLREFVASA